MDSGRKRTALEWVLAGGLTAVGLATGTGVLPALAGLAAGIGSNLAADLTHQAYHRPCHKTRTKDARRSRKTSAEICVDLHPAKIAVRPTACEERGVNPCRT